MFQKFLESEQERSRSLKNVTPLISGGNVWERRSHTFFWCGKAFPYFFALVTVLEDVRSK